MADIEKVIKGLEHCSTTDGNCQWADHAECPYIENCKAEKYSDLDRDALELLKEQKAKPDKCIICERCGHKLQDDWNWCPWCRWETARGKSVKQE